MASQRGVRMYNTRPDNGSNKLAMQITWNPSAQQWNLLQKGKPQAKNFPRTKQCVFKELKTQFRL